MTLFVYADESGVFDSVNNEVFVFGGVIYLSKDRRDNHRRKYLAAERAIRAREKATVHGELKAAVLPPKDKSSLFRSLNEVQRFAVVVNQAAIHQRIFKDKKSKQRYLDYAFKIGLKRALQSLIRTDALDSGYAEGIYVLMDEHTTATNGRYELQEALDCEFRTGTFNASWNSFHPPILPNLERVEFAMKDSQQDPLIRAADIVANRVFHHARTSSLAELESRVHIVHLP